MSAVTTGVSVDSTRVSKTKNLGTLTENPDVKTAINTNGDVFTAPDYSFKQILDAIPKHCFERSLPWSLHYVFRDIAAMFVIGYVGTTYIPYVESKFLRFVLYNVQSFCISLFGFGLWILAHECGHGAFSKYQNVNDFVGWVLHSYVGVPYFSWKYSHAKHHQQTGNMQKDTVFIPWKKEELLKNSEHDDIYEIIHDTPIYAVVKLIGQQIGGLQLYLSTNATGQPYPGWSKIGKSHFNPSSPLFTNEQYWYILISDLGLGLVVLGVYFWYKQLGGLNMVVNWFVPYLWINHWLVFVTFLQHTDPTLPHYDDSEWSFAKGAAATIDRDFGFIGRHIFHGIIDTHVLHHYVSRIPFYNAEEATDAIKKVMGQHYRSTDENMWKSLWKCLRSCQFVDGNNGIYMYRNTNGIGVAP
ncbi:hypothetical protein OGAPHI_005471 [Ogataea philodendri]|uniref:Fatty acid desaturase domain-containing protein n=1 Tax=Ogataea philodendri TaxID=1378263 RepID=A0A9P8T0X8_9ASCO|nr:uncharacterized protein OGAPHI_005471 [Ogataea philodendri]KAH3662223.1 hypothetical protein OGAPHI_005471 [Ogataea philodendri]